jgi:hypothetical protein
VKEFLKKRNTQTGEKAFLTCLREAPPAKALCGGQALRRKQGATF